MITLLGLISTAHAEELKVELKSFKAGFAWVTKSADWSASPTVIYTPRYVLTDKISTGADLGLSYFNLSTDEKFWAYDALFSLDYQHSSTWRAGFKIGQQYWDHPIKEGIWASGAELKYSLPKNEDNHFKNFSVEYLRLFDKLSASIIKLTTTFSIK